MESIRSITVTIEVDTNKQTTRVTFHNPSDAIRWMEDQGYVIFGDGGVLIEAMEIGG